MTRFRPEQLIVFMILFLMLQILNNQTGRNTCHHRLYVTTCRGSERSSIHASCRKWHKTHHVLQLHHRTQGPSVDLSIFETLRCTSACLFVTNWLTGQSGPRPKHFLLHLFLSCLNNKTTNIFIKTKNNTQATGTLHTCCTAFT